LTYDTTVSADLRTLIDLERAERGLGSLSDALTSAVADPAVDLRGQTVAKLLGDISQLQSRIQNDETRGLDVTVAYADLRRLQTQLSILQNG
jgi:hypothetical protein